LNNQYQKRQACFKKKLGVGFEAHSDILFHFALENQYSPKPRVPVPCPAPLWQTLMKKRKGMQKDKRAKGFVSILEYPASFFGEPNGKMFFFFTICHLAGFVHVLCASLVYFLTI
jgi:hypothetical protein